ncbi:MAG: SEC-C metal-binding domain-containing protein [Terracidiphilus sp.]
MRSHPREKTGRNDPCPCGSGKKYKHCCLSSGPISLPVPEFSDTPWRRQNEASDRLSKALLREVEREFADDVAEAWTDFNQTDDIEPVSKMPEELSIFTPYLIFEWDPVRRARRKGSKPKAGAVLESYLNRNAHRLSVLEFQILEQAISRPVSFYEVVRSDPGRGVRLRDLLIGEETEVEEHSASRMMRPGDLAYGQIWILPEVASLGRLAPRVIPPDRKIEIVKLRAKLRKKIAKQNRELAAADLVRYTDEIRTVYLDIRDAMRRPPTLQNTDGDPFAFHTLTFRIGSAQLAFDALASLAWHATKKELLDEAERSSDGELQRVEIPWSKKGNKLHETWDNTILGHLKIDGHLLTAEVNSANRAKKIRGEIEQRLGLHATHLSTSSQTLEESLKKQKKLSHTAPREIEGDASPLDPELMKEFAVQLQKEVEAWVHKKVPALGGLTPMQAVATPDGREMVEALLQGWERHYEGPGSPGMVRPDIDAVRRLLKLPVQMKTVQ